MQFAKWLIIENKVPDWKSIWKYYDIIKDQPTFSDLETLASLIAKAANADPHNTYGQIADFWGGLKYQLIPKLPPEEQSRAMDMFSNLKINTPQFSHLMYSSGTKRFASLTDFENFIVNGIENNVSPFQLMSVVQKPENRHFIGELDIDVKRQLRDWLREKESEQRKQMSIKDILKKMMNNPEDFA